MSSYVVEVLEGVFRSVRDDYYDRIVKSGLSTASVKTKKQAQKLSNQLQGAFRKAVDYSIQFHRIFGITGNLSAADEKNVVVAHDKELAQARNNIFGQFPLDQDDMTALDELARAVLISKRQSNQMSGLVFAGYGEDEMYPSLHALEIDGVIAGHLKHADAEKVDIDRTVATGAVIPFAQRDVTDRYLHGADPRFERAVVDYFTDTARRVGNEVVDALLKREGRRKAVLKQGVASAVDKAELNYWRSASPKTRDDFSADVNQMVKLMPKQELVSFAEALVNITSVKRKVSYEVESVGGPIDVAIISKHEGFIWVKRKHYFDGGLNPRYFWRSFGAGRGATGGS